MQQLLSLLYPPLCVGCSDELTSENRLCPECWPKIEFITENCCTLCGVQLDGETDETSKCDECLDIDRPWINGRAAITYSGLGRDLVLGFKHADKTYLAREFSKWMYRSFEPICPRSPVFVPVPLHYRRYVSRRYNQSFLLAFQLEKLASLGFALNCLERCKSTKPLDKMKANERFSYLGGKFKVASKSFDKVQNAKIVLVDDVMTSGATLHECTNVLLEAGAASVQTLVLARTPKYQSND